MDNRAKLLNSILPVIEGTKYTDNDNESFQNDVLRPILKFQNEIIILYFQHFILESKIEFNTLKHSHKVTRVHDLFKTNIQFKQFYLGLIVGYFSVEEFRHYSANKKEINKRIIVMLIERICSQLEEI